MRVAAALSAALASQELALFFEQPRTHAARAELARTLPVCGWVLSEAQTSCEDSDDASCGDERHGPPMVRLLSTQGSSRGFETTLTASAERTRTVDAAAARRLLRVRAAASQHVGSVVLIVPKLTTLASWWLLGRRLWSSPEARPKPPIIMRRPTRRRARCPGSTGRWGSTRCACSSGRTRSGSTGSSRSRLMRSMTSWSGSSAACTARASRHALRLHYTLRLHCAHTAPTLRLHCASTARSRLQSTLRGARRGAAESSSQFGVELLPEREALVLPEACRGAAVTGALPSGSEPLWRVTPSTRAARGLERCAAVAPYWVTTNNAADAVALGRSLPRGASWVAHLQRRGTGSGAGAGAARASSLSQAEVEALRAAGCAGVAVADPACLAEAVLEDYARVGVHRELGSYSTTP